MVSGWEGPGIRVRDARVPADRVGLRGIEQLVLLDPLSALLPSFGGAERTNVPWGCSRRSEEEREEQPEFTMESKDLTEKRISM